MEDTQRLVCVGAPQGTSSVIEGRKTENGMVWVTLGEEVGTRDLKGLHKDIGLPPEGDGEPQESWGVNDWLCI